MGSTSKGGDASEPGDGLGPCAVCAAEEDRREGHWHDQKGVGVTSVPAVRYDQDPRRMSFDVNDVNLVEDLKLRERMSSWFTLHSDHLDIVDEKN